MLQTVYVPCPHLYYDEQTRDGCVIFAGEVECEEDTAFMVERSRHAAPIASLEADYATGCVGRCALKLNRSRVGDERDPKPWTPAELEMMELKAIELAIQEPFEDDEPLDPE